MWCECQSDKLLFSEESVTFLSPNKKVTKEVGIGEALMSPPGAKYTLPYVPLLWRTYGTAQ